MPEKSLTIAAYAAGASLAAATLVYVFGPTFFLDGVDASHHDRKRIAVGLRNDANDCFINSTLQALAGLPTLRLYLCHELHLREVFGPEVYQDIGRITEADDRSKVEDKRPDWLRLSLQNGVLTAALKEMLDALNERPLSRKTISAQRFITAVEGAFKTKVSRYQQDAQEFLQLIMERVADERNAGIKARDRAGIKSIMNADAVLLTKQLEDGEIVATSDTEADCQDGKRSDGLDTTQGTQGQAHQPAVPKQARDIELPFEGKISSQIECMTCHFKPKSAETSFVTLTLNVPHHLSSTSLDNCLDGILKVEHIDDFRCDRCRLTHAVMVLQKQRSRVGLSDVEHQTIDREIGRIEAAIETDPENPPKDLQLPNAESAPKSRIARHMRISVFPSVLGIHLSRSVWDNSSSSSKNTAKVSFAEKLQLGSLLDRRTYKLMSVVTHKGGHNSGHYETFRRQWLVRTFDDDERPATAESVAKDAARLSIVDEKTVHEASAEKPIDPSPKVGVKLTSTASPMLKATSQAKLASRKKKAQEKWWRISDEKVKECKLTDVLGMQKEVYLLFYELVA